MLCTIRLLLDLISQGIEFVKLILDLLLQNLLKNGAEELQHHWLDHTEQCLELGLLQLDFKVLDIDIDAVDLEEILPVGPLRIRQLHSEAKAATAKEDVHNSLVSELCPALLALHVVGNVSQVHLDARDVDADRIGIPVCDLPASKAEIVVWSTVKKLTWLIRVCLPFAISIMLGIRLSLSMIKFSMTVSKAGSEYSILGMGT